MATALDLQVNGAQLSAELETLAKISQEPAPVVTRVVFTEADKRARVYVKGLCIEAGLAVREDAIGNTFARWAGSDASLGAVGTGSHIDAIPNAGMYDGVVGVLGGLEAIRTLQRAGFKPRRAIELLIFTSEEPTRFGIGCLGSRLLAGTMTPDAARALKDKQENALDDVRRAAGFKGELESVKLPSEYYSAFVELHIEQGLNLEREGIPLGVVTSIAAPASFRLWFEGEGGHAGGKLMLGRRDALVAAAEVILATETAALASGAVDMVATVGVCDVFPGAVNSIPSRVRLELDVRDTHSERRDGVIRKILETAESVAKRKNVTVKTEWINADAPAQSGAEIVAALCMACEQSGHKYQRMVSRAYHDSLFMARIAPVAMLFIPCRGGVSHRPDEYSKPEDIVRGTEVLARTLAILAN
jgi:N-carbamoyl-L-amino-acid hydrolase